MVDAVTAALNKDRGTEASPASEAKTDSKEEPPAAKPEAEDEEDDLEEEDFTADELKALNAKTRRSITRFRKQVADLKEPADRFRKIEAFMSQTGVPPKDVVDSLNILALVRSNPREALNRLREYTYNLSLTLGETLPADLQDKVVKGTIDEETARELATARMRAEGFQQAAETTQAENDQARYERMKGEISSTVSAWESRVSTTDPDFAAKQPLVSRAYKALVLENGAPKSAAESLRLMKQAYKEVSEDFRKIRPQTRQEVISSPASSATSAAAGAPKDMDDAIRRSFAA
jgi:hypothetical protein